MKNGIPSAALLCALAVASSACDKLLPVRPEIAAAPPHVVPHDPELVRAYLGQAA